jgi:hypothetical protein
LVGRAEVVVDRLRNAEHGNALLVKEASGAQGVLAADCDQAVESKTVERIPNLG